MPRLRLTNAIIESACEMRAYGGSDAACASHAGVKPSSFSRWLHYGEIIRDYLDNGNEFDTPESYQFSNEAKDIILKLQADIDKNNGRLTSDHRKYLKLWDEMSISLDSIVANCHVTIERAARNDPNWAEKILRRFYRDDYTVADKVEQENSGETVIRIVREDGRTND